MFNFDEIKNKIINADCNNIIKDIPDKYFNIAIVDTPYGIGEDGSRSASRGKQVCFKGVSKSNVKAYAKSYKPFSGNDKNPPDENYFNELIRISKNQIIFGANHFISKIPFDSSCWIVWDKKNESNDFADCELAWTSFKSAVRKFSYKWNGMLQENMKDKDIRIHPTQKPVALYRWLLQNYAKPNDKIIDTHSGSGSLACACHLEKFDFLAIEKDEDYYRSSVERLDTLRSQGVLF